MTPEEVVAKFLAAGAKLIPGFGFHGIPPELKPLYEEHRRAISKLFQRDRERWNVLEARYRALLRQAFGLVAEGPDPSVADCTSVLDEVAVIVDELGVKKTDRLRAEEIERWKRLEKRCPLCGGPIHEEEPT